MKGIVFALCGKQNFLKIGAFMEEFQTNAELGLN